MTKRPMYAILTLAVALLAAVPGLAAATGSATETGVGQPQAVADEPIFDAGNVNKGDEITHDFVIRNTGDQPLRIEEVRPACGCTVADYDEVIAPGESGQIHAVLDTTDFVGGISKGLTVVTNDPDNPRILLSMKAAVIPALYVRPGFARFVQSQKSGIGSVEQIIFTRDFDGLEVQKVESPYDFVEVDVREASEEERLEEAVGNQYVVTVNLDYDTAPIGALADYVRVHTNHPKQSVVSVPVSGFVRPMYVLTPEQADFGQVEVEEDGTWAALIVKNYASEDMTLELADGDLPDGIDVSLVPVEDGREYKLEITLGPELAKGDFNDVIRLNTGLEKQPTIEIPLTGSRI